MKRILLLVGLCVGFSTMAQIEVGTSFFIKNKNGTTTGSTHELKEKDLELLKSSKTVFILCKADLDNKKEFIEAVSKAWTFTPLLFVPYDVFKETDYDNSYSFMEMRGYAYTSGLARVDLDLHMKIEGEYRSFFCFDLQFYDYSSHKKIYDSYSDKQALRNCLYSEINYRNWNSVQLINALAFANQRIIKNQPLTSSEITTSPNLSELKNAILYIPDYAFLKMNPSGTNEKMNSEKIMSGYKYAYKIVSEKELIELVSNSNKPVYYLDYVGSYNGSFAVVFEARSSEALRTGKFYYVVAKKAFETFSEEIDNLSH